MKIESLSQEKLTDNHLILIKNFKFAEYPEQAMFFQDFDLLYLI